MPTYVSFQSCFKLNGYVVAYDTADAQILGPALQNAPVDAWLVERVGEDKGEGDPDPGVDGHAVAVELIIVDKGAH